MRKVTLLKVFVIAIIFVFILPVVQVSAGKSETITQNEVAESSNDISVQYNADGTYTIIYQPSKISQVDAQMGLFHLYANKSYYGPAFGSPMRLGHWADTYQYVDNYGLLRFNLAGFPYNVVEVKLNVNGADAASASVYRITVPWSAEQRPYSPNDLQLAHLAQSTLSKSKQTSFTATADENGWYSCDITNLYNQWKAGTFENNGILLKRSYTPTDNGVVIDPTSPFRPMLIITYRPTICIDPGHMPIVTKNNNEDQRREFVINNGVAMELRHELQQDKINVEFTRPLENVDQRANHVNELKPDFFISLHCNAKKGQTIGKEIYASEKIANVEHSPNVGFTNEPHAQTVLERELASKVIYAFRGNMMLREQYGEHPSEILKNVPQYENDNFKDWHVSRIAILTHVKVCPAVLLEMEYYDYAGPVKYADVEYNNMRKLLESSVLWRSDAAHGIYLGIKNYLNWYLFCGGIQEAHELIAIGGHSPIDLEITDSLGRVFNKTLNEIPDSIYDEGISGDTIYLPQADGYQIRVIPEEGALLTDTFTLDVTIDGVTTVLAENVAIADIPSTPYSYGTLVTLERQVFFKQLGAGENPTVTYSIDDGAVTSNTVPFSVTVQSGQTISYSYQAIITGSPGVQYALTNTTPDAAQTVTSDIEVTGNYKTQYQVNFSVNSPLAGTINQNYAVFYDSGASIQVTATPNKGYAFWMWHSTDSSVTFFDDHNASTEITINGPATVTAIFALIVNGNNHIKLTGSNNVLMINGGNNHIDATAAMSTSIIKAGAGNNQIYLGDGNNHVIELMGGNDKIVTGNGNNIITILSDGNNRIQTGSGNDCITVGNGNNVIDGGLGYDVVYFGLGNNKIDNCEETQKTS